MVYSVFACTLESRYESLWSIRYSHGALSRAVTSESLAFGFAFTLCEPRAASPADVRAVHRRRPRGLSINIIVLTLCEREVRDTARMADRAVLCLHSYGDTQRTARLSQTEKKSSERTTNKDQPRQSIIYGDAVRTILSSRARPARSTQRHLDFCPRARAPGRARSATVLTCTVILLAWFSASLS